MAHPGANQLQSSQQLHNGSYNFSVSAFGMAPAGFNYNAIVTSAQTLVKGSTGVLGSIHVLQTTVSGISGYDNTVSGGTVLFGFPTGTTAGVYGPFNVRFTNGLVVSTGGGADHITVMYY